MTHAVADKQVFPTLDIVGWYATGEDVNEADMHIHRKVCACQLLVMSPHTTFLGSGNDELHVVQ